MLILSRKTGESLIINENIEVKIVDVSGDKVKIGITAPGDIKILRNELCQTVESNKASSASINPKKLLEMLNNDADQ